MAIPAKDEYRKKIDSLRNELSILNKKYERFSSMRMSTFFLALILGIMNNSYQWVTPWWLLIFLFIFLILVFLHERLVAKQRKVKFEIDFFEKGVDRITGKWKEYASANDHIKVDEHLFANDLNLFGSHSLFVYLCLAYTQYGKERLKQWLTNFAEIPLIIKRQDAVKELQENIDFRLQLGLLAKDIEKKINTGRLVKWAQAPALFNKKEHRRHEMLAYFLSFAMFLSILLWSITDYGPNLFLVVLIGELIFYHKINKKLEPLLGSVTTPSKELDFVSALLKIIETRKFKSSFLCELQTVIETKGCTTSQKIKNLNIHIERLDMSRNQIFAPFAFLFMWRIHFGLKIERWRTDNGLKINKWLEVVGEFEAVNSIANYAYEHSEDIFPIFSKEKIFFAGENLGHPLINEDLCVRNSVKLDNDSKLWIVSGSNMSGKSTFLRVIGINLVLTYIGAPIRGKSLELSSLSLGTSIVVQDSLEKGYSKFYSEIVRLQKLAEYSRKNGPMLFLLDELLHGTNSHDRLIGAKAVISHLLDLGAIGLVTTHDLSLTKTIKELNLVAKNVHFKDSFEDGKMSFDYKLCEGVVKNSNALELMRSIGIKL